MGSPVAGKEGGRHVVVVCVGSVGVPLSVDSPFASSDSLAGEGEAIRSWTAMEQSNQ